MTFVISRCLLERNGNPSQRGGAEQHPDEHERAVFQLYR
ncbi:hypothetical protein D3OALGA1CA_555 [Olavius algarvensis associated proteobacterium Delta 3]|nr:hypothetical protein D3OALGA1CA_555 [Olavius algarvensis associated proteobacterium Delta 3]CAB5138968.1 hypothetical protein D3OALGB2SA_4115 [Olavius algarvensis associated proteobacterium Delta 3]